MIDTEITTLLRRAKAYANQRGYSSLADDFSQEVYIRCRAGIKTSFQNMFTDFLRKEFGDTRFPGGRAKSSGRHRRVSFDGLRSGLCNNNLTYADTIADPRGHTGLEQSTWRARLDFGIGKPKVKAHRQADLYEDIFDMLFLEEKSEREIGDICGVTESRISQIRKKIKEEVQKAVDLDNIWDEYKNSEDFKVRVNWIEL